MKNKNLPNKLINARLVLGLIIIIILLFPFNMINVNFKKFLIDDIVIIDLKMVIVGILFIIASITDLMDGYLARKNNIESDYGKLMDPIADKLLVNSILIILSSYGYIHPFITVVVVGRDIIIDAFRMFAISNNVVPDAKTLGKYKTVFLMIGISLKLFSNYPFALMNIKVDDFFLIAGTCLALLSMIDYIGTYKKYLKK